MKFLGLFLLIITPVHAIGFANGVKIGEFTDTSAVIWVRLTERDEADRRVDEWDEKDPMHCSVPGQGGTVSITLNPTRTQTDHAWYRVTADTDYCHQFLLPKLKADTEYRFEINALDEPSPPRKEAQSAKTSGSFRTAPAATADAALTFVVSTCQDFPRRADLANGHKIYKSMLILAPSFFVQTGDTLYYDKPNAHAKDLATARYKWNRIFALPNLREFHRQVPSYWLHDDHDVLKNDSWPGQTYGDLTWEQGLSVWREQISQSDKPYRTFPWGKHVQIWFPEGREYRSQTR